MNLLESYKIRLEQLNNGNKELYEGEADTIKEVITAMENETLD